MSTVLVLTVGGSSAPILSAIRDHQPDFVAFIYAAAERSLAGIVRDVGLTPPFAGAT
ncbi:MAG: hypothetical protein WCJ55_10620 [Chloroflexales bacterium]